MPKNLFPRKSVVSPDGSSGVPLYTLVTPQVQRASGLALEYVEDGLGQVITIQGPYGSGKSHLINFSIQKIQKTLPSMSPPPRVVQIYQRAISADFVSFYKELIKQIGFELLQEVNDRFLGTIALKEMSGELEKSKQGLLESLPDDKKNQIEQEYAKAAERRVQSIRADPKIIYQYLDNLVIQPEAVYLQTGSEVEIIAGENFKKAFFYLPDVQLGRTAYKWFVGDELTDNDLARLGVSSRLTNALDAKYALSLLVTLFRYAGIRLLIYFDQVEKLLLTADPKTLDENRGIIQSLAEIFPRENAFLALAGANDGWDLMREDFWSRVGATKVQLGTVSESWARSLIKAYLTETEVYSDNDETEESDIAPFSFAAVDEILKISTGNIRVFLQICHEAYKKYLTGDMSSSGIGPKEVNGVITNQFDEASVLAEIQNIVTQRKLRCELQSKLTNSFTADVLIGDKANPLAVVEIVNPLFYLDEAESAVDVVDRREALTRDFPKTRFIVVTIGYASDEVANRLNQLVDRYLVYDNQQFAKSFGAALDSISLNGHEVPTVASTPEVKDDLQELLATREREISELNERLQSFAQGQAPRLSLRHREWRSFLRADQGDWEKRQKELTLKAEEQRRNLQDEGENTRLAKLRKRSIFYGAGVAIFLIAQYFAVTLYAVGVNFRINFNALFTFVTAIALLFFGFVYYYYLFRLLSPLGWQTGEIANYSGDLGQLILRAKTTRLSTFSARLALRNPNPIIRYFGALIFLTRTKDPSTQSSGSAGNQSTGTGPTTPPMQLIVHWNEKAVTENWKPLYLTYLKLSFRTETPDTIQEMLDLLVEANVEDPRILYLIAMAPPSLQVDIKITGLNAASPAAERVLALAIFERRMKPYGDWQYGPVAQQPIVEFALSLERYTSTRFSWLAELFQQQGQFWTAETEAPLHLDLDEDELSSLIRALSPHIDSGLASFTDLPGHNFYLKVYRFFLEISWRLDQGDVILKQ